MLKNIPRILTKPVRVASSTFDASMDIVKVGIKATLLVALVGIIRKYDLISYIPIERLKKIFLENEPKDGKYYDQIFERIKRARNKIDETTNDFDLSYEDLIDESKYWLKTWRKIKKVSKIPVSIGSSVFSFLFSRYKKNENTDMPFDGSKEESSKATKVVGKLVQSILDECEDSTDRTDEDFSITYDVLRELKKLDGEFKDDNDIL